MGADLVVASASAVNWVTALVFLALLLSWWAFLIWWISRFGAREVRVRFRAGQPPEQALHEWLEYYGNWLARKGYQVVEQQPGRLQYAGRYRPRWEIAAAWILFPVGLVFLLGSKLAEFAVTAGDAGIDVDGTIHRRMANELEKDAAELSF